MIPWYQGLVLVLAMVGAVYMGREVVGLARGFWLRSPVFGFSILVIESDQGAILEGFIRRVMGQLSRLPGSIEAEIVIVDQGSSTETRETLRRLARMYAALMVYYAEPRDVGEVTEKSTTDVQVGYFLCRFPLVVVIELQPGTGLSSTIAGLTLMISSLSRQTGRNLLVDRRNLY